MAEDRATGRRPILVVALAVLGGVTGIVFGRVFLGTHPAVRLAIAGVAASLLAALFARRAFWLSLLASIAGLVVALGALVFSETTWAGLPTARTIESIVDALGVVTQRAAAEIAPAPPLPALMTASLIAVWSASTASHALAVRSGTSVLPLLPPAGLLAFSGVVTEDPPRPGYVLLFLGAAFGVLFAEALERTTAWGSGEAMSRAALSGRWARILGATGALAAIAVPGVLPGFGSPAILELDRPDASIGVSPIVDIRPSLLQNPVADLFWVRAERPAYWRMVVLDRFDGRLWSPSETEEAGFVELGVGAHPLTTSPAPQMRELVQEVEIGQLAARWLPAAGNAAAVTLEDDLGARHDLRTGELELAAETSEGVRYEVTSTQAWPSARALDPVIPNNPLGDPRYTDLPEGIPDRIRELAHAWTERASTPLEEILAIQERLRTFTYDDRAPAGHGTDDLLHFLERSRRGYCEQFAGAMAVLVRALGYPARVAIGFLPGTPDDSGRFRVTTAQVHAWPEVHFDDYGWLAFEPTPGRSNPAAGYLLPEAVRGGSEGRSAGAERDEPGSATAVEQRESFRPIPAAGQGAPGARQAQREEPLSWWRLAALAIAALAVTMLAVPPFKALRRRISLARAHDPRRRVLAAYEWLLDAAGELGLGRQPSETPREYERRLAAAAGVNGELNRLTRLVHRAVYGNRVLEPEEAVTATEAARATVRTLRRGAGVVRTLVGAVRSRPG